MTSVLYCIGYRALTQCIRGFHQTHHEPLHTVQEDARSEVFWARLTSGEDWLAHFCFNASERKQTISKLHYNFIASLEGNGLHPPCCSEHGLVGRTSPPSRRDKYECRPLKIVGALLDLAEDPNP